MATGEGVVATTTTAFCLTAGFLFLAAAGAGALSLGFKVVIGFGTKG